MNENISKCKLKSSQNKDCKCIVSDTRLAVSPFSGIDKQTILMACRMSGLRKPQFYREAIINKAKTIVEAGDNHVN